MAKIRHIALLTDDQPKLADFYCKTFGMKEIFRQTTADNAFAIYLSDGYINLAILPARGRKEGIYHFGFQVDDEVEKVAAVALENGAKHGAKAVPQDGRFNEAFITDPAGTRVDLAQKGWKV
jgi:catechol 2,3-dioxygenase-like lactoylglutathione lyase family enzyme